MLVRSAERFFLRALNLSHYGEKAKKQAKRSTIETEPRMRPLSTLKAVLVATILVCSLRVSAELGVTQPEGPRGSAQVPAAEAARHGQLPLTKFYDTPAPLPAGKAGDLIRSQPFDDYYISEGISAVRILYHSVSANGEDVAASGVVLIPDGTPPAGGWPVIAWAHRFIGTARPCAPSLMRGLHSGPFLSMYVNLGYVVVATDYVGLGTSFRNAFVDFRSNATDVIHSVPAARAAVPQLSSRWVAMGDAEGGAAALAVAELESQLNDPNYLGSVAVSGAMDLKTIVENLSLGPWNDIFAALAYGTKTVYPQFQVEDILTDKGMARYHESETRCAFQSYDHEPPLREMLKPSWESNSFVTRFLARNSLGLSHARAPLLVISAEEPVATASMATQVVKHMCQQKDRIDFEMYPGLDAAGVIGGSVEAQIAWIKARFVGRTVRSTCP
jgi:hypothetical protein